MTPATSQPKQAAPSVAAVAAVLVSWPPRREIEAAERPVLEELGKTLRTAREAAGVTLADLGPVAGSRSSLAAIEAGTVRTRASRIRPYLERVGVDPEPVIARFAAVLAPERPDGRNAWRPVTVEPTQPRPVEQPPELADHDLAALGAELWRIRVRCAASRPALATVLGVNRFTVWLIEHGQRHPSLELLGAWLALAPMRDRLTIAKRFPELIAQLAPRPGAHRPKPPRTHGRVAASPASKESP